MVVKFVGDICDLHLHAHYSLICLFAYHAQSLISSKMNPQTQKLHAEADSVCDATVVWNSSLTHTLSLFPSPKIMNIIFNSLIHTLAELWTCIQWKSIITSLDCDPSESESISTYDSWSNTLESLG